ncbi:uncharacterized protein LOC116348153 [Contarinia nasturtii]|uniref:uncharacterized protein LOC116348153 n=1 Tax=Contarinia nasturtii TaxID=265458 RepID=UPI0012D4B25F|nr:uncharacterized protein LOC116348153 [Contarinia nasturtii]
MIEPIMQLLFECYDCDCVDRAENCVDKVNCEILYALSSYKSFDIKSQSCIVMLKKWLFDSNFEIHNPNNIEFDGLSMLTPTTLQNNQQVQPISRLTYNSFSIVATIQHKNHIQMYGVHRCRQYTDMYPSPSIFHTKTGHSQTKCNAIDCNCFPNSINGSCYLWGDNIKILPQTKSNHKLFCNEQHYIKIEIQNNFSAIVENQHKQPCKLSSTKLAGENWKIATTAVVHGTKQNSVCAKQTFDQSTTTNQPNANQLLNDGNKGSAPSKASLKFVQRSPLTVVHRSNLLNIFIKYLLILNCLMCVANGNLMSRNVENDLNNKHNQTNIDALTTHLSNSPLTSNDNGRKGISTTVSPHILQTIMSNNNPSQFQVNSQTQSQKIGRSTHHHLHHQQQQQQQQLEQHQIGQDMNIENHGDNSEEFSRCASCQFREQLKAQNLASIKMHILTRIGLERPPNITGREHIPEHMIENFYLKQDSRYIRIRNGTDEYNSAQSEEDVDDTNEMQGDDPGVMINNKHQHHHIYNRNGGVKNGLHEQHHHHQPPQYYNNGAHSRHENDFSEDYDGERSGIVYKMDYFDELRSSSRFHYDDMSFDRSEETDEAFYSTTDVVYSFPKLSKARHRGDILEFTVKNNNHLSVSGATFNMYVRGEDWLAENEPNLLMRSGNGGGGGGGGDRSNVKTGVMNSDENAPMSTASTSMSTRDEQNIATSSDSLHKVHGNSKIVNNNNNHLSISINRFVHRHQQQQSTNDQEQSKKTAQPQQQQQQQQQRYTRIDSNFVGEIPKGAGEWIQFNITLMVSEWIQQQKHQSVNTQSADIVQEVVIKTLEPWMRQLLVLDTNSKNRPYIEIQTRDMRKHRTKRHLAKDCRENERQTRCCRYPLRVDFRKFGWDWIIAPDIYEAYYCAGECPIGFLPKHPHTYIYSLSSSFQTCCSPRKLSPLSLLYFDDNKNVVHSIIPNMAVEKCGCS